MSKRRFFMLTLSSFFSKFPLLGFLFFITKVVENTEIATTVTSKYMFISGRTNIPVGKLRNLNHDVGSIAVSFFSFVKTLNINSLSYEPSSYLTWS
jgi:hypothetical protein